jgi:vacuolar-type H+-ATPase subunit F/Vma7
VLAVSLISGGIRDMIDLGERFDMDLTTNYIAGMWSLSRHCQALNIKTCVNELAKKLKKRYDCIIISANVWQVLDKNTAAAIMEQVAQGTGLIVTVPDSHPEALNKIFAKAKGKYRKSAWQSASDSAVVAGIPFEAIPESLVYPYTVKGKVLARAG